MKILSIFAGISALLSCFAFAQSTIFTDKTGQDVLVMQMWIGKHIIPTTWVGYPNALRVDLSTCKKLSDGQSFAADCSQQVQTAAKLDGYTDESPLLNMARYSVYPTGDGLSAEEGMCNIVEIVTLTRESVYNDSTFKGIGFYISNSSAFSFVNKSRFNVVGRTKLWDGSSALVTRFVAWSFCGGQGGNPSTLQTQYLQLKPYAQYETINSSGTTIVNRIWEDVPTNFEITRANPSFDRKRDLLEHFRPY